MRQLQAYNQKHTAESLLSRSVSRELFEFADDGKEKCFSLEVSYNPLSRIEVLLAFWEMDCTLMYDNRCTQAHLFLVRNLCERRLYFLHVSVNSRHETL